MCVRQKKKRETKTFKYKMIEMKPIRLTVGSETKSWPGCHWCPICLPIPFDLEHSDISVDWSTFLSCVIDGRWTLYGPFAVSFAPNVPKTANNLDDLCRLIFEKRKTKFCWFFQPRQPIASQELTWTSNTSTIHVVGCIAITVICRCHLIKFMMIFSCIFDTFSTGTWFR